MDRVASLLLPLSGTNDPGGFEQASETFSAPRRLGQRVELRNFKDESHWPGSWSKPNLRGVVDQTIAWFTSIGSRGWSSLLTGRRSPA